MHPDDVADYVAESVLDLEAKLREEPALGGPVTRESTKLYIPFVKTDRELVDASVDTGLALPGGQQVRRMQRVVLLGRPPTERQLLLGMDLADFDAQPPTAELLLPDRTPLPPNEWPKSLSGQGIVANHKDFDRPFFCRRGLREYHTHPQHEDDPWDKHREGLSLASIAIELLRSLSGEWIGR